MAMLSYVDLRIILYTHSTRTNASSSLFPVDTTPMMNVPTPNTNHALSLTIPEPNAHVFPYLSY